MGGRASTLRTALLFMVLLVVLSSGFWLAGLVLGSLEPVIGVNLPFSAAPSGNAHDRGGDRRDRRGAIA
ncbi:hypothetical protein [Microbacterium sp. C7(2022)]|uniref:hypothetical protein n=1 Tax=Microbacterium sp. C7(2022) TaxID=2992759 RepID=UPI00237B034B|nr:hypothetical protein [Microbacterium sp. C7(2022)]MDE0546687.1 hypothetical protein [Microbacterium sp. C7(2022)]